MQLWGDIKLLKRKILSLSKVRHRRELRAATEGGRLADSAFLQATPIQHSNLGVLAPSELMLNQECYGNDRRIGPREHRSKSCGATGSLAAAPFLPRPQRLVRQPHVIRAAKGWRPRYTLSASNCRTNGGCTTCLVTSPNGYSTGSSRK